MATEVAGRGEFAETVTYHVLSDVNRNEFVAVVDSEGEPDEFGGDHRSAAPRLDDGAFLRFDGFVDFLGELDANERAFFN